MRSALTAATGVALLSTALLSGAARAQPVSGLYVGAGGGVGFLQSEQLRGTQIGRDPILRAGPNTTAGYKTGYVGLASVGYGFGNGVRLEIEGSERANERNSHSAPASVLHRTGSERKFGAMANVLFDMDVRSPYIFPYLGAGAGYQSVTQRETQLNANGETDRTDGSKGAFAYQAIFGASLPIPPVVGLSATVEYRFLGLSGTRKFGTTTTTAGVVSRGTRRISGDDTHQILVGLRYAFNVTPPVEGTPPAAPVAVVPAPAAARSFLVFFDWDRADLTDRARSIIAEAAAASTKTAATRIEVAGHADRTGAEAYNQVLSRKRAAMVAAELVRRGVPASAIAVSSYGDTQPLVPTAAGVREPQNRRVEIVLK